MDAVVDAPVLDAPVGTNACQDIINACHDVDPGSGPLHDCHELGHDEVESACAPERDRCVALCGAAMSLDGGHTHGEDAHTHSHGDAGVPEGDGGPHMHAFSIRFAARAGDAPATCGETLTGLGLGAAQTADLVDFRFYVHGIELLTATGAAVPLTLDTELPWQNEGVALLDFEDNTGRCTGTTATRDVVRGMAPEGTYTGIRFVLGVPFDQNHQDASVAEPPLNVTALFWNWQGGYKFARIDTSSEIPGMGGARTSFNVHLGSTGCDGTPAGGVTMCMRPNRPVVELSGFDPETSIIVADYAQLVEGVDLTVNTPMTAVGCMSGPTDPECAEVLTSFGLPFGTEPAGSQDFFRVETP
jgi:uncharacterized repeat protein (TIGR04052 family)